MQENVAEVTGEDQNERAVVKTKKHIFRTIDRLNVWDRFAFLREETTDQTLTEGDKSISMHEDTYIPLALHLVNLDGDVRRTLTRIDYEKLVASGYREDSDQPGGWPKQYAVLNPYDDRTYYFWPFVDEKTATELKMREVYYKRLGRPSGDSDLLRAPEEVSALIEAGAQFRWARIRRPNHTALWSSLGRDFAAQLREMTVADERDNPEPTAWGYGPTNADTRGEQTFLEAFWRF